MSRLNLSDPPVILSELKLLLSEFDALLKQDDLREKVKHLAVTFQTLRDLGVAVFNHNSDHIRSARERILQYFKKYPNELIDGDEIMVVSGIQDYPRRIRELRVQFGWQVVSGVTLKEMIENGDYEALNTDHIKPDCYILIAETQDKEMAFRWNLANSIRKKKNLSVRDRILDFLRNNTGKIISGEELRYVADNKTEWARRVRELRTEYGWPIYTSNTGRLDIPRGMYILEEDRQNAEHDRAIDDTTRVKVLTRDQFSCRKCNWKRDLIHPDDPRVRLELHHVLAHARKGGNDADNLVTLCNVCHDLVHKLDKSNTWPTTRVFEWLSM